MIRTTKIIYPPPIKAKQKIVLALISDYPEDEKGQILMESSDC